MDSENREKVWGLLGQDEPDSKRLGLELLASLGEESFAELVEEPLAETALDTLLDLIANYPDAALQLVKKGYSSFSGAPFTLVQFRLVSALLRVREPEKWGWMPNQLTCSDASWDDTSDEEQLAFLTGVTADLKALGQQLLAKAGGLDKALPPADREARYEGYYGWVWICHG